MCPVIFLPLLEVIDKDNGTKFNRYRYSRIFAFGFKDKDDLRQEICLTRPMSIYHGKLLF
jgi:hypothetical protein